MPDAIEGRPASSMKIAAVVLLLSVIGLIGACVWLYTPDKPRGALERRYAASPDDFLC